jgi:hypothetical protein
MTGVVRYPKEQPVKQPPVLKVEVAGIGLDTVISEIMRYNGPDDDPSVEGHVTIGDMVASQVTALLVKSDEWEPLRKKMIVIRTEMIRDALAPLIEEALAQGFRKTNGYGEPIGDYVTLRQLIIGEVHTMMKSPNDGYCNEVSPLRKIIQAEIQAMLAKEIKDVVAAARQGVADEIGQMVSAAVAEGMRKR